MPRVMIDAKPVDVPEGTTILEAARRVDIDIPALCHFDGLPPNTSCMLCVVEIEGRNGVVPACAHPVSDGIVVQTETPKLCELRRLGLEMLLCDHVGDCHAPCQHTCPLDLDVPAMLRHVGRGDLRAAIETIRTDMALPAVLGRVCPELCERTCRRAVVDQPAAVCRIKQFVADEDAATDNPYLPQAASPTGKRVAVIGAGPAGLSAAYYLALAGHKCTVLESHDKPGGRLITNFDRETLPESVIASEVALLERLGVTIQCGRRIEGDEALQDLVESHDAVLLAVGRLQGEAEDVFGLPVKRARVHVDPHTWQTSTDRVFACGDLVHPTDLVVLCVAGGKRAASGINQVLSGRPDGPRRALDVRTRTPSLDTLSSWLRDRDRSRPERIDTRSVLTLEDMQCEAERCLGCDCQHRDGCLLRQYSERYGASKPWSRTGDPPHLARRLVGPNTEFEPGKCIRCGICVAIAEARGEPIGVTFINRGYDLRIDLPFASSSPRGLDRSADECIHACPTGALSATDECLGVSLAVS